MTAPILGLSNCFCGKIKMDQTWKSSKLGNKLLIATPILDAIISITCAVLGGLALNSVILMPPAAAYALLGVSGGITLLWIALAIKMCCESKTKQRKSI